MLDTLTKRCGGPRTGLVSVLVTVLSLDSKNHGTDGSNVIFVHTCSHNLGYSAKQHATNDYSHSQAAQSMSKTVLHWGSPKYYESRNPGPHFPMKLGTRGPRFHTTPGNSNSLVPWLDSQLFNVACWGQTRPHHGSNTVLSHCATQWRSYTKGLPGHWLPW